MTKIKIDAQRSWGKVHKKLSNKKMIDGDKAFITDTKTQLELRSNYALRFVDGFSAQNMGKLMNGQWTLRSLNVSRQRCERNFGDIDAACIINEDCYLQDLFPIGSRALNSVFIKEGTVLLFELAAMSCGEGEVLDTDVNLANVSQSKKFYENIFRFNKASVAGLDLEHKESLVVFVYNGADPVAVSKTFHSEHFVSSSVYLSVPVCFDWIWEIKMAMYDVKIAELQRQMVAVNKTVSELTPSKG